MEKFVTFKYEELVVIRRSRELAREVYRETHSWPKQENYSGGLANQARRASVSVSLNIAEGSGSTKPDFARFVRISIKSLLEVRECFAVALELGYCSTNKKIRYFD